MVLLYHFWQYRAYFSVRYCLKNVAILVAIVAVNKDDYRKALDAAKSIKEDKAGWISFFHRLHSAIWMA